jgi:hypothetical protein
MFVIFESNGGIEIGLTCMDDDSGEAMKFSTEKKMPENMRK